MTYWFPLTKSSVMAFLLNRNPAARFECLHALCKFILHKFGVSKSFNLMDVKFNRNEKNIHCFCTLLTTAMGIKYCPYKQSPLDDAGCSLTNGVNADTTKSKEVGNTINALHALGFINRVNRDCQLTEEGARFANTKYDSAEMVSIIRNAVLNYGPAYGVLYQIKCCINKNKEFNTNMISVGYPNTKEYVSYNGRQIQLSVGSEPDANTRTRSCLLAWLTTAGFIYPKTSDPYYTIGDLPQKHYREYLNDPHRNIKGYFYNELDDKETELSIINKPLDYNNLTKLTAALRENDSKNIREATLNYENRIKNRRFAIVYVLNDAYKKHIKLDMRSIERLFIKHSDTFLISQNNIEEIIVSELDIAIMCGIPFEISEDDKTQYLNPLNGINLEELSVGVPNDLLVILKNFVSYE